MKAEDWDILHDKVLVRRDETITEKAGLTVPQKAQRQQAQGTVLKVGPGVNGRGLTVKPGDTVRFTAFSGVPLVDDDEDVILLREDELLAYWRNRKPHPVAVGQ